MIDLKQLRADPERFKEGARDKGIEVDIDRLTALDQEIRTLRTRMEECRAEQKKISRVIGPELGKLKEQLRNGAHSVRDALEKKIKELEERPTNLKSQILNFDQRIAALQPEFDELLLLVPLPPDPDVPKGRSSEDNVEIRRWNPPWFEPWKLFRENKGFVPKTHLELVRALGLVDFERGVKMSGTRHYVLTGEGARLHQAVLRLAFDAIVSEHGFTPMTIPVIVREECMVGTGFFPAGREQAYHIVEPGGSVLRADNHHGSTSRATGHDLFLAGTGEVALMALHQDEILDAEALPLKYATVSTCFRREAGAAGKETAGLFRIHQFDKVEQVVICRADEAESRELHQQMIAIVESLLQKLELAYRLVQCCTADLGPKNAAMVDIECWMPGRGAEGPDGRPRGAYGETHSASRLYDYQCRRLNLRYRDENGKTVFCHSLNNTVIASPRILIPILEMYQNQDGSVTIPTVLRPYMSGREKIQ